MASLLSLPPEILVQILRQTIPLDFEASALSCKTLFAASTPLRPQYNTRQKRFRNFKFSSTGIDLGYDSDSSESRDEITQDICIRTTRELLEQIAVDPSLVQYIQSIDLSSGDDYDEEEDDDDEEQEENEEDLTDSPNRGVSNSLRNLVLTSPFIQAAGGSPDTWIKGIRKSSIYADVFLLTLLSHVQELSLHPRWDELNNLDPHSDEGLWPVLKLITHRANHQEFPDAPLSMLSVLLPLRDSGYDNRSPSTPLVPLLAINSVSEVSLCSCVFKDDGYTGFSFDPLLDRYSTNLRTLSLTCSVAGPEELSQLLSRIPNLEVFEFSHETKWQGCGDSWNVGAFLDVIQNTYAETLQELSVTMLDRPRLMGATLVDMTRFQKLTVLELEVDMLCNPKYDPSMAYLSEGELERLEITGSPAWPRLIQMLPASIESFTLHLNPFNEDAPMCVHHLVEGFSDVRATKFPNLEKLRLFVKPKNLPLSDMTREALKAAKRSGFSIHGVNKSISI